MLQGRRRFLLRSLRLLMLSKVGYVLGMVGYRSARAEDDGLAALGPFLDTLIPRDETPGAVDLGIDKDFLELARKDRLIGDLLQRGCRWLDAQALKRGANNFSTLSQDKRDEVAGLAAGAGRGTQPGVFFRLVRDRAMFLYYSTPKAWAGIGFNGPPQWNGYPDYQLPPRTAG